MIGSLVEADNETWRLEIQPCEADFWTLVHELRLACEMVRLAIRTSDKELEVRKVVEATHRMARLTQVKSS
jgi:hypothetical protein